MDEQKKYTEKERQRIKMVEGITEDLAEKHYIRKDMTFTALKATLLSVLWAIVAAAIFYGGFVLRNGFKSNPSHVTYITFGLLMLVSFGVHEVIHGLTWGTFAPHHFKCIELGFMKTSYTPYCTCKEPLKKWVYILGGIMPCLLLGVIPCLVGIFSASMDWLAFGMISFIGAGGDLCIMCKMLSYKTNNRDVILMDHPAKIGFIVFERLK